MKKIGVLLLGLIIFSVFTGCSTEKVSVKKLKDIDFTVANKREIPKELRSRIDEKGTAAFKLSYADDGELYIAVGYGEQPTSGYSIEVKELYETKNAIYIQTNLIGPAKEEKVMEVKTYPYIVVKMEKIDKNIVFK